MSHAEYFAHPSHSYENDYFQSRLTLGLEAVASIMSVLLILWALGVV
jgi:hypothetical protein